MNLPAWTLPACLFISVAAAQNPLEKLEGFGDDYRISAALGDVDGDGVEDLVLGRNGAFDVRTGLSRKPRRFAAARTLTIRVGPTCESAGQPRLVDVDRDGDLDLLTLDAGALLGVDPRVVWFANDGTGNFGARQELKTVDGKPLPRAGERSSVELVDWDGDGLRDLVVSERKIVMYRGLPGGFEAVAKEIGPQSRGFAVVDWNGDGRLDLLTQQRRSVVLHERTVDGLREQLVAEVEQPLTPLRVAAADWDLDGQPDLLLGNHERGTKRRLDPEVLEMEQEQLRAARRVLDAVHAEMRKLRQTRPPLEDPEAMARRRAWEQELQRWAEAPKALSERVTTRRREALRPQHVGILQVLRH